MKKLRLFDSLKFVRFVVAAIVCAFILNVAHADTTAIQSVIAYGKTEQSATPTPTNPVPIMTNNGELKVNKNLFNQNDVIDGYVTGSTGAKVTAHSSAKTFIIPCKPRTKYTFYFDNSMVSSGRCNISGFNEKPEIGSANIQGIYTGNGSKIHSVTFTTGANVHYLALWLVYSFSDSNMQNALKTVKLEGTYANGVYADGMVETIRDAAGHKATTQMLLGLNDTYRDEQNINTGAITRKIGVTVLDGTENWFVSTTYGADVFIVNGFLPNSLRISANNGSILFSTHFAPAPMSGAPSNPKVNNTMSINSTYHAAGDVWIRSNNFSTVAQFKSWLAEQYAAGTPVIVVYPLNASAQTTESITAQSLTTAPVRQTLGAIMDMPIKTILTDNTEIMSGANELIKIATTKYNEESFEDVQGALTGVFNAVDTVVSQTMTQAQAIDTIATTKQTRPDEGCTAKYCLLVEGEDGTPHWYPIAGANGVAHNLPAGYTELQYIESTGTQYIDPDVSGNATFIGTAQSTTDSPTTSQVLFANSGAAAGHWFGVQSPTAGSTYAKRWGLGATPTASSTIDGTTKVDFEITFTQTSQSGTINDQTITRESSAITHTDWVVFAGNTTPSYGFIGKVWGLKIVQNDVLVRNLIPAKNSLNVVGMYDLVSGQFFTNAGTGDFTAGPDM